MSGDEPDRAVSGLVSTLDPLLHEPARLSVLSVLSGAESMEFSALVKLLEMRKPALSKHLSALAAAGVVEVTASENDRRGRRVAMTPAGRDAFDAYLANLEDIVRRARGAGGT